MGAVTGSLSGNPGLAALVVRLGFTPAAVERRIQRLELTPAHRAELRALGPALALQREAHLERFYATLSAHPTTRGWLEDGALVARLKRSQAAYLDELVQGDYGYDHARRCVEIGRVHHRVRLAPQLFLSSYAHYLCDVVPDLFAADGGVEAGTDRVVTLVKSALLDAAHALEGYAMSSVPDVQPAGAAPGQARAAAVTGPAKPAGAPAHPVARRLRVGDDDATARATFLGLDQATQERLRRLGPLVEAAVPVVTRRFYDRLDEWAEAARLIQPEQRSRLEHQVAAYWLELAHARFDRAYAASRTLVGVMHERVGLMAPDYIIAFTQQLGDLLRAVITQSSEPVEATQALLRAVFFDLSFVLEAYVEARAEAVLRTHGFASELLAGLASAVVVVDSDLRVDAVNPALLSMFDLPAGLVQSSLLLEVLPLPDAVALVRGLFEGSDQRRSAFVRGKVGLYRATAIRLDASGGHERAALVLDDVTDVARLESQIQETEGSYGHVVDAVQALVWEVELPSFTVTMISRSAVDVTGHRDVALLGRPHGLSDLLPEPDREHFVRRCRALAPGERVELRHRIQRADGAPAWLRSEVARSTGEPACLRGVSTDITAQHAEEDARLESLGRLAGGIAHEFNNRFTVVLGALEMLHDEAMGSSALELVDEAIGASRRSAELARQLLGFARRQPLQPRPVDLNQLITEGWSRIGARLSSSVRVELRLAPGLWSCNVDQAALEGALTEVVANAAAVMPDGGRLVVSTENLAPRRPAGSAQVCLRIVDTGPGMDDGTRYRAFEPFFTTKLDASGLGLSMVRGFVLQSGGEIELSSGPTGTTVELRFVPLAAPDEAEAAPPQRKPSVLVVDDEPAVRRILSRSLVRAGYDVVSASGVDDAKRAFAGRRVDVLVCDVVLQDGETGVELAEELLRAQPWLSVVFMSGFTRAQLDLGRLGEGQWFIPKPFGLAELERVLAEALDRSVTLRASRDGLGGP
jgi:signal transduction histidine kinase/ActR/RegA family two-component response regulator